MNAYITHKDTVIRLRSGRFDVHVGDHAPTSSSPRSRISSRPRPSSTQAVS